MPGGVSLAEVTTERPRPRPRAVATNQTPSLTTGDITFNTGSTGDIWTIWVSQTQIVSSATSTSNVIIWRNWVEDSITSGTIRVANNTRIESPSNATSGTVTFGTADIWTGWIRTNNPSHEQLQEMRRRQADYTRQAIEAEAERAKARERAEKLLHENLDDKQRAELAEKGYFELDAISANGQRRRYRIHRKWSGNIHQIDPSNGQRLKTLCIHPREATPVEDSMLAQKLMIEGGMEEELLRIANHS